MKLGICLLPALSNTLAALRKPTMKLSGGFSAPSQNAYPIFGVMWKPVPTLHMPIAHDNKLRRASMCTRRPV